jgi:WD40 repeat protein
MSRDQAIAATERAGAAVLAPGVATLVVDFVASRDGTPATRADATVEPVLLSLCCYQLNRRRAPGGRIDENLVRTAGQDILQSFYEEALAGMPDRVRRFIETHLIQGDRYRGSYPRDEAFAQGGLTPEQLAALTDRFRLLRIDRQADTARIELIHDRLVGVVRHARDERLLREREEEQRRLRERAEQVAREEAERRQLAEAAQARMRWMRNVLVALAAVLVVALAGVVWQFREAGRQRDAAARSAEVATMNEYLARQSAAVATTQTTIATRALEDQEQQKKLARSRELIAFALQQLDQDPELSVLLAREAIAEADTAESVDVLRRVLGESHVRRRFQGSAAPLRAARFLRDGRRIVTGGQDGVVRIWDSRSGQPVRALGTDRLPVRNVWATGDGGRIVARSTSDDERGGAQLTAWDADTLAVAWKRPVRRDARISLSPCCGRLVIHAGETLTLLDTAAGREIVQERLVDLEGAGFGERGGAVVAVTNSYQAGTLSMCGNRWTIHRWRAETGERLGEPVPAPGGYGSVSVNPYGMDIVSGAVGSAEMGNCAYLEQPVWLLMPENRPVPLALPSGHFASLAFSPTSPRVLAVARGPLVHLWVATGRAAAVRAQLRYQFPHAADVVDVRYSDDGGLILGAEQDAVRVWAPREDRGTPLRVLRAQGHRIVSAGFSADRRHVLTAGADGTARLWEIPKDVDGPAPETCKQCRTTADWLALAGSRLTRTFSPDEAKRYGIEGRSGRDQAHPAR